MSYVYENERPWLFTEKGVEFLRDVEDKVNKLLEIAGAFQECKIRPDAGAYGSWELTACLDYLVEKGKLVKWERRCWGQFTIYADPKTHNR